MGKQREFDHIGRIDVLKERPAKKNHEWIWGLSALFIVLFLISQCS